MTDFDKQLVAEFLEENYAMFQDFLLQKEIEPTEAVLIIDSLKPGEG